MDNLKFHQGEHIPVKFISECGLRSLEISGALIIFLL